MRNLLKFLIRMNIVPVFHMLHGDVAFTEIEALRLAESMGIDTNGGSWWVHLYNALHQEGFNGLLKIQMSDFFITIGGEHEYEETYLEAPFDIEEEIIG